MAQYGKKMFLKAELKLDTMVVAHTYNFIT